MAVASAEEDATLPCSLIVETGAAEIVGRLVLGEDAAATCPLEMAFALLASALETAESVTLAADVVDARDADEGKIVVIDASDWAAMLESMLEASEGSTVSVSEEAVEVGATVTVTVTTPLAMLLLEPVVEADAADVAAEAEAEDGCCVRVAEADAEDVTAEAEEGCCVKVADASVDTEVETGTEAEDDSEALSEGSLSSSPSQSIGSSTAAPMLLAAIPPVAPDALMIARAVAFVEQEMTCEVYQRIRYFLVSNTRTYSPFLSHRWHSKAGERI